MKKSTDFKPEPPRWARRLLHWVSARDLLDEIEDDLDELFSQRIERFGLRTARRRYALDVVSLVLRPTLITHINPNFSPPKLSMLRNYIKIAWRNALIHKVATIINVVGLTMGFTGCFLIFAYVSDELAFDRFHEKADRIVLFQQNENSPISGGKFATDLKSRFPQIADAVRMTRLKPLIKNQQTAFYESNFWLADSSVFKVFTFPLVSGNPNTALKEQGGVVISQAMARKYFGDKEPLGQSLRYNNRATLQVTGVLRDLPPTSHLKIDFLASYIKANELAGYDVSNTYWGGVDTWTYLLLAPGATAEKLQQQFPAFIKQLGDPNSGVWKLKLIPLTDLYLRTDLVATNRLTYVYIFTIVALLILGLACFNYINLATARATKRAREVGVRKVMGSSFFQLWGQFMGETIFVLLLAVALSVAITLLILPFFNNLAEKQLTIHFLVGQIHLSWLGAALLVLALIAGGYPAVVLSSFQPVKVLKGYGSATSGRSWLRQTLVVAQFSVSIGMIVATMVVYYQLQFVRNKSVGYQREQILTIDLKDASNDAKEHFKQQITTLAGVEAATRAFGLPGSNSIRGEKLVSDYVPKGSQTSGINRLTTDGDYLKTFGIKLLAGRALDPDRPADKTKFLVNQAAMKFFGWQNIEGKKVGYYTFAYDPAQPGGYKEVPLRGEVIGVVEDYNYANLKQSVAPLIISLNDGWEGQLAVRLGQGNIPAAIQQIQQSWSDQFPEKPFVYEFLDDVFNRTYQTESRTGQVFGVFAGLAVLISCLGLFGLATFTAEQRTKEIGVRKVLGASVSSVVGLLSKELLKLVLLAILIASPLAWYAMNRWLQDFAYKITIGWWMFVLAGLMAMGIALLTVSFQSIKAARMNPVKSLKNE